MKHLKTYKIFESDIHYLNKENLEIMIDDILQDLRDDSIEVEYYIMPDFGKYDKYDIAIYIRRMLKTPDGNIEDIFPYSKIRPNVEHLVSFLYENGYKIKMIINQVDKKTNLVEYKSLQDDSPIGWLEITFKRKRK